MLLQQPDSGESERSSRIPLSQDSDSNPAIQEAAISLTSSGPIYTAPVSSGEDRFVGYDLLSTTFHLHLPMRKTPVLPPPDAQEQAGEQGLGLTPMQLVTLLSYNFIPYIGFGIMDNVIMLTCGDAIDSTLGVSLGISTLAAAALGNCISNSLGFATSDAVERLVVFSGLQPPRLTAEQV